MSAQCPALHVDRLIAPLHYIGVEAYGCLIESVECVGGQRVVGVDKCEIAAAEIAEGGVAGSGMPLVLLMDDLYIRMRAIVIYQSPCRIGRTVVNNREQYFGIAFLIQNRLNTLLYCRGAIVGRNYNLNIILRIFGYVILTQT